jgi:tRNA nucleotidyltransferase/poly(A) polymerase
MPFLPLDPQKQRDFAVDVVRTLRSHGFESYWAGGCVRDRLLGQSPKDYDVATTALPDQIREVFKRRRTVPIGAQFGVITVVGPKLAGQVEVATFRQDVTYSDGRHPDAIQYSTPEADAHRRDFTINGLFYDPLEDRVIDYVGGVDDLGRRLVRAIGEPRARFQEDKLRLLRAVRFTATFDFALDAATRAAVEAMGAEIGVVSIERISEEMRRMLTHRSRTTAVELLRSVGLLEQILPELSGSEFDPAALAALHLLQEPTFPLALATLILPSVDAPGAWALARRWKLSNDESKRVQWLVEQQAALVGARQMSWSRLQPLLTSRGIDELIALHAALAEAGFDRANRTTSAEDLAWCHEKLSLPPELLDPPPLLTGDDLLAHRVPRGKAYQWLLQAVRDAQLDEAIFTRAEALELVDRLRSQE